MSWERVDVSFSGSKQRFLAHNTIQVGFLPSPESHPTEYKFLFMLSEHESVDSTIMMSFIFFYYCYFTLQAECQ